MDAWFSWGLEKGDEVVFCASGNSGSQVDAGISSGHGAAHPTKIELCIPVASASVFEYPFDVQILPWRDNDAICNGLTEQYGGVGIVGFCNGGLNNPSSS